VAVLSTKLSTLTMRFLRILADPEVAVLPGDVAAQKDAQAIRF
jgi:hypothetical protein